VQCGLADRLGRDRLLFNARAAIGQSHIGERYLDRYVVWKKYGSTGEPGICVQDEAALSRPPQPSRTRSAAFCEIRYDLFDRILAEPQPSGSPLILGPRVRTCAAASCAR